MEISGSVLSHLRFRPSTYSVFSEVSIAWVGGPSLRHVPIFGPTKDSVLQLRWVCLKSGAKVMLVSDDDGGNGGSEVFAIGGVGFVDGQGVGRYLSNDHGCWSRILRESASLEKRIKTILDPRSQSSKSCMERHMLLRVHDRASMLALRLVKSFAIRTLLLSSISNARGTIWLSCVLNDSFAHHSIRSSMASEGG
nr:hypothetical protein CFP56_49522 [Quercus suber]